MRSEDDMALEQLSEVKKYIDHKLQEDEAEDGNSG
jgi:hypothetical protein